MKYIVSYGSPECRQIATLDSDLESAMSEATQIVETAEKGSTQ